MPRFENTIKQFKSLAPSLQFFALSHEDDINTCAVAEKALQKSLLDAPADNPKRRKEFLQGRYCLSEAIRQIPDFTGESWYGRSLTSGRPPCPSELLISLSHCNGASLAVAGMKTSALQGIGVDIEDLDRPIRDAFLERITSPEERMSQLRFFEKKTMLSAFPNTIALSTFSAKEAAYKALPGKLQSGLTISKVSIRFLEWQNHSISFQATVETADGKESMRGISVFDSNLLLSLALFV